MKENILRVKKKIGSKPVDRQPGASALRRIGTLINRREFVLGVSEASRQISRSATDRISQARLLGLVGDSEYRRGRFEEAAKIYTAAATKSLPHHEHWLRPMVGQVRALLLAGQVEAALMMARQSCAVSEHKDAKVTSTAAQAEKLLAEEGVLTVTPRPPRLGKVASRMGALFLQEGEWGIAEEFFNRARAISPGGACRACQGLARMALARGEASQALSLASESIRNGKFAAKTIASWPILIRACRQSGGWQISPKLLGGLSQAEPSVRARAVLVIVTEMRNHDIRQWRGMAEGWLRQEGAAFPVEAAELRKMLVASSVHARAGAKDRSQAAQQLLKVSGLSALEWLAATKVWVQAQLDQKKVVDVRPLLNQAVRVYGVTFAARARHGLALAMIKAGRDDLARPLLQQSVREGRPGSVGWGKGIWTLARLELRNGGKGAASALFQRYAAVETYPARFRLQALTEGAGALAGSGATRVDDAWRAQALALLDDVHDANTWLDMARQLRAVDMDFADELYARGEALALAAIRQAEHPLERLDHLFRLTRRQVGDFGRCQAAVDYWDSMPPAQRDLLWSEKEQYWEYLAYLAEAYVGLGRVEDAEALVRPYLSDPATPPCGIVHLQISRASWLLSSRGGMVEALASFRSALHVMPNHKRCALAYFWEALLAFRRGDGEAVTTAARRLREVQGARSTMRLDAILAAKSRLLEAGLRVEQLGCSPGERREYEEYRDEIRADLEWLEDVP